MKVSPLLLGVWALSFSAMAEVSFEEKQARVQLMEQLHADVPALNVEAYQRDLHYERQNLSLEARAQNEVNLLAEKIKNQVALSFEAELQKNDDPEAAAAVVRESIERDLLLASPEMQVELKTLALEALEAAQKGSLSSEVRLENVEKSMLKRVEDRAEYLNHEASTVGQAQASLPSANPSKDSEKREYTTKRELLSSLVSDRDSTRWLGTSSMTISSGVIRKIDTKVSYQLKFSFLGVAVEGGPSINFIREYNTNAQIIAEGLNPVLLSDGNFDFWKRDMAGKISVSGGKQQKRFVAFFCEASEKFATDYSGGGNFSIVGVGGGATAISSYSNEVNLTSRRVYVPEYLDGKTVTLNFLNGICHNDFLSMRLSNTLTVKQSLNAMMGNVISSLQFSHAKTKCATDTQCMPWFRSNMQALVRNTAYPRCAEEPREKYRACVVKGLSGTKCPVFKNGRQVSSGMFEYACDTGLRCVQTREHNWLQSAEGVCRPINARTYRSPLRR